MEKELNINIAIADDWIWSDLEIGDEVKFRKEFVDWYVPNHPGTEIQIIGCLNIIYTIKDIIKSYTNSDRRHVEIEFDICWRLDLSPRVYISDDGKFYNNTEGYSSPVLFDIVELKED